MAGNVFIVENTESTYSRLRLRGRSQCLGEENVMTSECGRDQSEIKETVGLCSPVCKSAKCPVNIPLVFCYSYHSSQDTPKTTNNDLSSHVHVSHTAVDHVGVI